jgi:hypothetical protein
LWPAPQFMLLLFMGNHKTKQLQTKLLHNWRTEGNDKEHLLSFAGTPHVWYDVNFTWKARNICITMKSICRICHNHVLFVTRSSCLRCSTVFGALEKIKYEKINEWLPVDNVLFMFYGEVFTCII